MELKVPILKKASVRADWEISCVSTQYSMQSGLRLFVHYGPKSDCDMFVYEPGERDQFLADREILEALVVT